MSGKGERIFEAMNGIRDKAIEEAAAEKKAFHWKRWAALAAAIALVTGAIRILPNIGGGAGGAGSGGASTFMSYAGPVLPLTLREKNAEITAERDITLDFASWDPALRQTEGYHKGIQVTDAYTLKNGSGEEQTVSLLYPFASDLYGMTARRPVLTLDGQELETVLHAGNYSGGFQGAWGSRREGLPEQNLAQAESWEAYRAVLSDGTYQRGALEDFPDMSGIPVVVYEFLDPWGPEHDRETTPTIRAGFRVKIGESTILTTGFHGGTWDTETGAMTQSFSIPREGKRDIQSYRLVVLGEDIVDLTVHAYDTGGPEGGSVIENAGVTVHREESDLETVLREIAEEDYSWRWTDREAGDMDFDLFFGLMKDELAAYYDVLSADPASRYADVVISEGDLDFCTVKRVFYIEAEVTVPAGGSVTLTAEMLKDASFDHACADTRNRDIYGYDVVTKTGTNLTCTRQTATLEDHGWIKVVRDNFGFDLRRGIKTVELSPEEEHYYIEVRQKE